MTDTRREIIETLEERIENIKKSIEFANKEIDKKVNVSEIIKEARLKGLNIGLEIQTKELEFLQSIYNLL